jgi:hypothetical protein
MYATGIGVEKSLVEAAKWHRFAAEQGTARGQYLLGLYYVDGSGVPRNYVEAYKWLSLAIAQDDSLGKDNLNALEKSMTPEQIAEAQRLAREFKPRKP